MKVLIFEDCRNAYFGIELLGQDDLSSLALDKQSPSGLPVLLLREVDSIGLLLEFFDAVFDELFVNITST